MSMNYTSNPSKGNTPVSVTITANTTKLLSETVAAPLDVSNMIATIPNCGSKLKGTPYVLKRKITPIDI